MKFSNFLGGITSPNFTIDVHLNEDDVSLTNYANERSYNEVDFHSECSSWNLKTKNHSKQNVKAERSKLITKNLPVYRVNANS